MGSEEVTLSIFMREKNKITKSSKFKSALDNEMFTLTGIRYMISEKGGGSCLPI